MEAKEFYHAGIYLRLSREDRSSKGNRKIDDILESNSIRSQKELCMSFIKNHKDIKLYDVYIEMKIAKVILYRTIIFNIS